MAKYQEMDKLDGDKMRDGSRSAVFLFALKLFVHFISVKLLH